MRKSIPLETKLAAALAMLLPQEEMDQLRRERAPAKMVLSRFHFHHGAFHALTRDDHWSNLTPMLKADHQQRTRTDLSTIAKIKRLEREHEDFRRRVLGVVKRAKEIKSRWMSKRKIPHRPKISRSRRRPW
jgi:hypothetical protein